jgi:hypothetical protein
MIARKTGSIYTYEVVVLVQDRRRPYSHNNFSLPTSSQIFSSFQILHYASSSPGYPLSIYNIIRGNMDYEKIARDVYSLAESDEPIAPVMREALEVIEQCLDQYG